MTTATPASSERPHVHIRTMVANARIEGVYNLVNPQVGVTKNGDTYLKCLLRDASGEMPGRRWKFDERELEAISATGFVWVEGTTELYEGKIQLRVEQVRSCEVSEQELAHLLPMTPRSIDAMAARLAELLDTLAHPGMRALVAEFLRDDELMMRFRRAPAAMSLHHAWIGGLLEHTLQLLELADRMLPLYPQLNRDLVMVGLFLHDIGKVWELTWERGFNYTLDGNLVGHLVRGAIVLQAKAALANKASGNSIPSDAIKVLQHIVLSHHGSLAFGSAKLPSTPEAIFVAMLDNLDARTQMSLTAARSADSADAAALNGGFTEKIWALETRLYRPDPLA
ncbi:MAG: HD domain-containing protein [Phycisphaerales bacterium]